MTNRAERTPVECSPAVRPISSPSWCRRPFHAVAATTIGIAVIAGCSDDDDTSPADLDAQLACNLLERWGGKQAVEERGIDATHLPTAAAAAGQAAGAADDRYEALGDASNRLAGIPVFDGDGPDGVVAMPEAESLLEPDAFVSACADVGYEIDKDAAHDEAAAPEIADLACERAGRLNDAWTVDEIEIKGDNVRGVELLSRRMAVARAGIAAGTYDERFAGLKDAGKSVVLGDDTLGGVNRFDPDRFQDAIDALQQECQALPSD